MNKLDEIALRVAEQLYECKFPPARPNSERLIKFVRALLADPELLAELSKDAEPDFVVGNDYAKLNLPIGTKLFTQPSQHRRD